MKGALRFVKGAAMTLVALGTAQADEGMWLFEEAPTAKISSSLGVEITPQWLSHLRLASVRFNSGGSGSFVSSSGLIITNHHVAADCIQQLSTPEADLFKLGFVAREASQERKCPNLEVQHLLAWEDVSRRVVDAAGSTADKDEGNKRRRAEIAAIEKECSDSTGMRCQVVTLYPGAKYHLYISKRYQDVRLVWAPELALQYFGGEPDNFHYPRHALDVALLRAFENDKPVVPPAWLTVDAGGAAEGEPVFVTGHPGRTSRLLTMAQLETLRDRTYPLYLEMLDSTRKNVTEYMAQGPEERQRGSDEMLSIENGQKAISGYLAALRDADAMAAKRKAEEELRAALSTHKDPARQKLALAWKEIEKSQAKYGEFHDEYLLLEGRRGLRGALFSKARHLLRLAAERGKPNSERLREYTDAALDALEHDLRSDAPIHPDLEEVLLRTSLALCVRTLGADHPAMKAALAGLSVDEAAKRAVAGSTLHQAEVRRALLSGGPEAILQSNDSMLALARAIDPEARRARTAFEREVEGVEASAGSDMALARFEALGANAYPDATFTLRLSFGRVQGLTDNGKSLAPHTTLGELYARATDKEPTALPRRWRDARNSVDASTALNVISTNDIIGGNSGSPLLNAQGELVGVIFDGNAGSLGWNFAYTDATARAISVDVRAVLEALDKVYQAPELTAELRGVHFSKSTSR
jgi:hypothetical protein